jgi:Domain of unknown function (DUF4276)
MSQLFVGFYAEGNTDYRFLTSILQRTLEDIAFDCSGQIDISLQNIKSTVGGTGIVEKITEASRIGASDYGVQILCIHLDADDDNLRMAIDNRFLPAKAKIETLPATDYCKVLVPIIPVYMSESWMLADLELLKSEIGTKLTNDALGLTRQPEQIARPKDVLNEAIRIASSARFSNYDISLSELYLPLGQSISLQSLRRLPSFVSFESFLRDAFRELHYLH